MSEHKDPGVAASIAGGGGGLTFEETEDTGKTVTFKVFRGEGPIGFYKDYTIKREPGMVVLDAIHRIQDEQAPELACRWNCKAGKCGSCSAEINGKPALMCMTRLSDLEDEIAKGPVRVAPLKAFPVKKDLVTDVSWNYKQNQAIAPFTPRQMTDEEKAKGEFKVQQLDVDRAQEFRKCIECFLCQDVCHVLRTHEKHDEFAGPRFMIRYAGLEMNPMDEGDRIDAVWNDGGIGMCNITKCCTEVCPEHIKITDNAIIPLKERVVNERFDPLVWLWRKLTGGRKSKRDTRAKEAGLPMAK